METQTKVRKKDISIQQILNEAKIYNSKKHLLGIKQPLSNKEVERWITSIKQTIDAVLSWKSKDYDKIKTETEVREFLLEKSILYGNKSVPEELLNKVKLAINIRLYDKYKFLSRSEISTAKRNLTLIRDELEIEIYKKCAYREGALEKIIPNCVEYLEMQYQKNYSILDVKTETIKKNQTAVKTEIEFLENEKFNINKE